jgi:hypothetical protein
VRVLRAILGELLGLFVADWTQTGITVGLLVAAWLISRTSSAAAALLLVAGIVVQLVVSSVADARRREASSR